MHLKPTTNIQQPWALYLADKTTRKIIRKIIKEMKTLHMKWKFKRLLPRFTHLVEEFLTKKLNVELKINENVRYH